MPTKRASRTWPRSSATRTPRRSWHFPKNADIDSAGLSEEGFSTAVGILNCVDPAQFIEDAITELKDSGVPVDEQCVRDSFKDVDFSEFTADGGIPEGLQDALFSCVDLGAALGS